MKYGFRFLKKLLPLGLLALLILCIIGACNWLPVETLNGHILGACSNTAVLIAILVYALFVFLT